MQLTKILVTGSNGLVGKYLEEIINQRSMCIFYNIIYIQRNEVDLRDETQVLSIFKNIKPDIVIHLAASVGGLYFNMDNNYQIFMDNVKINGNILTACDKFNVSKLINVLSTCVFPDKQLPETSESIFNEHLNSKNIHDGKPHPSNEGYSYSKRLLEIGSRLLSEKGKLKVVNLIPTNLYGKYDNFNIKNGHVIPALIHKMYLAKRDNTQFNVLGSGLAKRQFVYAGDFAEIIIKFVNLDIKKSNVSCIISPPSSDEVIITDIIDLLQGCFEFDNPIVYSGLSNNGQLKKTCNDYELKAFFDFKFTTLKNGLQKTTTFFIQNYPDLRF